MRIKGQTAMEYLMTYGWAILIIIVVVAALYAMGVFSTKGTVACSPCFSYFAFRDYDQTTGTATCTIGCLYIRNGARTIEATVTGGTLVTACGAGTCGTANACSAGTNMEIESIPTSGDQIITIDYKDCDTGVTHTDSGTIHNK